jgi:hypothetical protein
MRMGSIFDREKSPWPRGQKFKLSPQGMEAEAQYQAALQGSRDKGGRAAFEEATRAWAAALGVQPGDGAYLAELRGEMRTLVDLVESLQDGGATKLDAKNALERLVGAKLAEPVQI